jgi:hypothetical protein
MDDAGRFRPAHRSWPRAMVVMLFDGSRSILAPMGNLARSLMNWADHHRLEAVGLAVSRLLFLWEFPETGVFVGMLVGVRGLYRLYASFPGDNPPVNLRRQLEMARAENAVLRDEVLAAHAENGYWNDDHSALVHENDTLRQELEDSRQATSELQEQLEDSQRANQELRDELATSRARISTLETTVGILQWQLSEIQESPT